MDRTKGVQFPFQIKTFAATDSIPGIAMDAVELEMNPWLRTIYSQDVISVTPQLTVDGDYYVYTVTVVYRIDIADG